MLDILFKLILNLYCAGAKFKNPSRFLWECHFIDIVCDDI